MRRPRHQDSQEGPSRQLRLRTRDWATGLLNAPGCWLLGEPVVFQKQPCPQGTFRQLLQPEPHTEGEDRSKLSELQGSMALVLRGLAHSDSSWWPLFLKGPGRRYLQVCHTHAHPACPRLPSPKTLSSHPPNLNIPGCPLCYQQDRLLLPELPYGPHPGPSLLLGLL